MHDAFIDGAGCAHKHCFVFALCALPCMCAHVVCALLCVLLFVSKNDTGCTGMELCWCLPVIIKQCL